MQNLSRNDVCSCGSGKKFKKCCIDKKGLKSRSISMLSSAPLSDDKTKKLGTNLFAKKEEESTESAQV